MNRRHPKALPRLWLMTDERLGDGVIEAVRALPPGSGVIVRHYATPLAERRALFSRIRAIAMHRDLTVIRSGSQQLGGGEAGVHGRHRAAGRPLIRTVPVHGMAEARAARRAGADLVFLSPVHPTRSHPGAEVLSRLAVRRLAMASPAPVILLGGMTKRRARGYRWHMVHGWAAIDAFSRVQKRKAVPT